MKPYIEKKKTETVTTTIKEYPHLFWYENRDDYLMVKIRKAQHSSACWCRASDISKAELKRKEGTYAWEYVEGESLVDGGA